MVRPDRLAALIIDGVFVGIVLPIAMAMSVAFLRLEVHQSMAAFTLVGSALVIGEAMLHSTIGTFLTAQRIVSSDGRYVSGLSYALRAIIKYVIYLLIWPASLVDENLAALCAVLLIPYPVLLAVANGVSMLLHRETMFDHLTGLTVAPLVSSLESEARGFEPIAGESPLRVEPANDREP